MNIFFSVLSAAYIVGIFLLADSSVVSDIAPFNPYSLLHVPLYGILTLLLILSNWSSIFIKRGNSTNPSNSSNPINLAVAGIIAIGVAIADEVHQAFIPTRNASLIDVILDIVGIMFCLILIRRLEHVSWFSRRINFFFRRPLGK